MLLAVDIGNTMISFAVMKDLKVVREYQVSSLLTHKRLRGELRLLIAKLQKAYPGLKKAIVCSVVPNITQIIESSVKTYLQLHPSVIGKDVNVPIKNNYYNPKQVGQDRLVCAYAAKKIYGKPAIIIDFGTAITFEVVSKHGEYEGGMIVPGIQMSADSLFQRTALLPRIEKIKIPRVLIGKDTKSSILSGLFFGYAAMCSGLIETTRKSISGKAKVVLTGGYAPLMKKFLTSHIDVIDSDLVFKGMALISKEDNG